MVQDSALAAGFGPTSDPVRGPITGMVQAVAGMVLGRAASAQEVGCAATGAGVPLPGRPGMNALARALGANMVRLGDAIPPRQPATPTGCAWWCRAG